MTKQATKHITKTIANMINKLIEDLDKKYPIFLTKQPTNAVRNSEIFRTFMDMPDHSSYDYRSLSLIAAADRIQHSEKTIKPELNFGKIVISDRYFFSCLANLRARGYKNDTWIYEIGRSILKPDLAFFLDVPVDIAISRVRKRKDEKDRYIDVDLQYKLAEEYKLICKTNGGIIVPSFADEEHSFAIIKDAVDRLLASGRKYQRSKNGRTINHT